MIDELEKAIASTSDMLNELVEKLDPVLQPEQPIPTNIADESVREQRSVVCNRIEGLRERIQSIKDKLSLTFSRLDLP